MLYTVIKFKSEFTEKKLVIGMIHLQALPGTPNNKLSPKAIIDMAIEESLIYKQCEIDAIMIENMHDRPYLNRKVGHEITSLMAIIGYEIKQETNLPTGIQVLAGANKAALAIAHSSDLDFIRAEGFIYSHIADEGKMNADAAKLLRYRKSIDAEKILIFTDIKKKHSSHAITNDISVLDWAKSAEFFLSDGLIVTGLSTGEEISEKELMSIQNKVKIPIIAGSGITIDNIEKYFDYCDAFIVGSHFKKEGNWVNKIDKIKVEKFMDKIKVLSN